jgi:hypothetical protein
VNTVTESPRAVAQMNLRHVKIHRWLPVHETGGLGETFWGTRLVPTLRSHPQGPDPGRHGLEKSEHYLHRGSPTHLLGLMASGNLAQSFQFEDSGACPPLGTRRQLGCSLQKNPG